MSFQASPCGHDDARRPYVRDVARVTFKPIGRSLGEQVTTYDGRTTLRAVRLNDRVSARTSGETAARRGCLGDLVRLRDVQGIAVREEPHRETPDDVTVIPFNGHIKTAEQRTIIEQYGDWYTGR